MRTAACPLPAVVAEVAYRRRIIAAVATVAARIPGGCAAIVVDPHPIGQRASRTIVEALLTAIETYDLLPVLDDDDRALNDDTDDDPLDLPFWMVHIPLRPCDAAYAYGCAGSPALAPADSPGESLLFLLFAREDDEERDDFRANALSELERCSAALPVSAERDALTAACEVGWRWWQEGVDPAAALSRVLADKDGRFVAAGAPYACAPTLAAYIAGATHNRFLDQSEEMARWTGMYTMPWAPDVIVELMDEWARAQEVLTVVDRAVIGLRDPVAVARLAALVLATFDDADLAR